MLLLGVVQAQAFEAAAAGSYDLLQTEILTASQASVTFSSLGDYATDYQHLQIRAVARSTRSDEDYLHLRLNGDTATNYSWHHLYGDGSIVGAEAVPNANQLYLGVEGHGGLASGIFSSHIIDILDPFETTKFKTIRTLAGISTRLVNLISGNWRNTDSITSITIKNLSIGELAAGSRFSLYGLKKASV